MMAPKMFQKWWLFLKFSSHPCKINQLEALLNAYVGPAADIWVYSLFYAICDPVAPEGVINHVLNAREGWQGPCFVWHCQLGGQDFSFHAVGRSQSVMAGDSGLKEKMLGLLSD